MIIGKLKEAFAMNVFLDYVYRMKCFEDEIKLGIKMGFICLS